MARSKPLADLVDLCLGPSMAARGFAQANIVAAWPDIVGAQLSLFSRPVKIDWRKRRGSYDPDDTSGPGALVVQVESAFALDIQHLSPVILERINAHYGWRCIDRLVLKQGPVSRPSPPVRKARPLTEGETEFIDDATKDVTDEKLRSALAHLGQAVLSSKR